MSIKITSKVYSGRYGTTKDRGTIISSKIVSDNPKPSSKNKEAIFVLDLSMSMKSEMNAMVNSLKAFRDAIIEKHPKDIETLDEKEKDKLFRKKLHVQIIPFSEDVIQNMCWSSESSNETYDEALRNLRVQSMTNMGAGMSRAFELVNPNRFSWIIVMTDGESNAGKHRTKQSFQKLAANKPLHSKIFSLGYGEQFNPEILNNIGEFIYLDTSEKIPLVFGNLAGEIMTSWAYNCRIEIGNNSPIELFDDTIIPSIDDKPIGKLIVGEKFIGTLYDGKIYNLIYILPGVSLDDAFKNYNNKIKLNYSTIHNSTDISKKLILHKGSKIPTEVIKTFFNAEKSRLIYRLYLASQSKNKAEFENIQKIISDWNLSEAEEFKDEIQSYLNKLNKRFYDDFDKHQSCVLLSSAIGSRRQEDYTSLNNRPNTRNRYTNNVINSAQYYESNITHKN